MANRYAVATGTWDTTNTSIWSATDGGAPGASAPTSSDKVLLTAASGAITVTLGANVSCLECIQTGFTGTLDWAGNKITVDGVSWVGSATCTNTGTPVVEVAYAGSSSVSIAGSSLVEANAVSFNVTAATGALTVSGGVKSLNLTGFTGSLVNSARAIYGSPTFSGTATYDAGTGSTTFAATSGTQVITSNGVTLDFPITVNAPGATVQLADALTMGSTRTFTHTAGSLDLNGFNLTTGLFSSSNTNVRSITSGAGQFYCTGTSATVWTTSTITNLTMVDRPTINVTGAPTTGTRTLNLGALAENRVPTVNISAGTATLGWDGSAYTMDFTGYAGTLSNPGSRTVYGNLTYSATMTPAAGVTGTTFAATSGTQVITSNGVTLDFPITVAAVGATVQLADALTLGSTRTFTLTNGSLDLNGFNLTAGAFSSSNTNVRSITSGAGQFYLTAASSSVNDVVVSLNTITNLTLVDRPTFNLSGNGSGTAIRQAGLGAFTEAVAPDINVTAGTDTAQIPSNSGGVARSINFTGFSGTWAVATRTIYGNLTASATMTATAGTNTTTFAATSGTQVITSNGVALDFPITVNAPGATVQLADALTMGSTRTFTHTAGSLDLNGFDLTAGAFSSSNANVRSITSGAGQFYITGTSGTVWSTSTVTNLTMVDRPTLNVTGAPTTGTRTLNLGALAENRVPTVNISAGTATLGWDGSAYTMDFTGYAGTLSNPGSRTVYGNLTYSATMTPAAGATGTTFAATSGTQVITSNGVALDFPIIVSATGATVQLADALTMAASRALTLTGGTFDANNKNVTTGNFTAGAGATTRVTSMGSGTWTILDAGATAWSTPAAASHTVTPSTSTILMTAATAKTFAGGGRTFWNLSNGGAGALSITGANMFDDLQNTVTPATFTLPASTTTTVSALSLQGTSGNLVTLDSSTPATRATLSKASGTVDVSYLSIKDSAATGGATFLAVPDNGNIDAGNNTGWKFSFIDVDVSGVEALGLIAQALVWALVDDGNTVTWVEIPT